MKYEFMSGLISAQQHMFVSDNLLVLTVYRMKYKDLAIFF